MAHPVLIRRCTENGLVRLMFNTACIQGGPEKKRTKITALTLQPRVLESCDFHQNLRNLLGNKEII